MARAVASRDPNQLQLQIGKQIVRYIRTNRLEPGTPLTEVALAEACEVSRTPVRAALEYLADQGVVHPRGSRGFVVGELPEEVPPVDLADSFDETLYLRIVGDFMNGEVGQQFSEADLMRRYEVGRSLLNRVLQRMARDQVIARNPGHGWRFAPVFRSTDAEKESYRFRMIIEPAALLESGYQLDRARAEVSRRRHEAFLSTPPEEVSHIRFFEMNAEFHEMVVAGAGNTFLLQAVEQQNRLRRFLNYQWSAPPTRITESCSEHLAILDALEAEDQDWAAALMRRHLEIASR